MNNQAIIAAANAAILVDPLDENRKKRKGAEGASAPPQEIQPIDLLNILIKDHLFFKQEAQPVIDANSLVVLFKDFSAAKKFAQSASSWHDHEPAHVPTRQKRQPHPWGPKKVFLMIREGCTEDARQPSQTDSGGGNSGNGKVDTKSIGSVHSHVQEQIQSPHRLPHLEI